MLSSSFCREKISSETHPQEIIPTRGLSENLVQTMTIQKFLPDQKFFLDRSWKRTKGSAFFLFSEYFQVNKGLRASTVRRYILFKETKLACRSVSMSEWAISMRRFRVKYLLKWNSFSSSSTWFLVYAVRWRFSPRFDPEFNRTVALRFCLLVRILITNLTDKRE